MDVRVIGLRARPELNGSTVVALTFVLDRGRFAVETSTSERLLVLLLQLMCASPPRAAAASARPPAPPRAPSRPLCAEWPRYVAGTRPSLHVFEKRMLYNYSATLGGRPLEVS